MRVVYFESGLIKINFLNYYNQNKELEIYSITYPNLTKLSFVIKLFNCSQLVEFHDCCRTANIDL